MKVGEYDIIVALQVDVEFLHPPGNLEQQRDRALMRDKVTAAAMRMMTDTDCMVDVNGYVQNALNPITEDFTI